MNKKRYDVGVTDSYFNTTQETETEKKIIQPGYTANGKKIGRPVTNTRKIDKASQEGCKEAETRATFIVKEDLLKKLKDYAYYEERNIKDVVNEMLEEYLQDKTVAITKSNNK